MKIHEKVQRVRQELKFLTDHRDAPEEERCQALLEVKKDVESALATLSPPQSFFKKFIHWVFRR